MTLLADVHFCHFATTAFRHRHASPTAPLVLVKEDQVYAVCADALQHGIRRRQTERTARALCPTATFATAEPDRDLETFTRIITCIEAHTDQIELLPSPQSPHFTLAMPVKRPKDALDVAKTLGAMLRHEVNLSPAITVAESLFTAKTIAAVTPAGNVRMVSPHHAPDVLAGLPLSTLPLSEEVQARLRRLGIYQVGQFAALPPSAIAQQFGKEARLAYERAHGRDPTPLQPRVPTPTIAIPFVFEEPIAYELPLFAAVEDIAARMSQRLVARRVSATELLLTVHFEADPPQEQSRLLRAPIRKTKDIVTALGLLFQQMEVASGITELHAIAQGLVSLEVGSEQLSFLDRIAPQQIFDQWWPRLVQRYGHGFFKRVVWVADSEGRAWEDQFVLHPY